MPISIRARLATIILALDAEKPKTIKKMHAIKNTVSSSLLYMRRARRTGVFFFFSFSVTYSAICPCSISGTIKFSPHSSSFFPAGTYFPLINGILITPFQMYFITVACFIFILCVLFGAFSRIKGKFFSKLFFKAWRITYMQILRNGSYIFCIGTRAGI